MSVVHVFTDGSSTPNPGIAGWAYIACDEKGKPLFSASGSLPHSTNNKMELQAAVEALTILHKKYEICLYSDSNYLVKGMNSWTRSWIKNGWKTAKGKPVENEEIWKQLLQLCEGRKIKWQWVQAHSGNHFNEIVDKMAKLARDEQNSTFVTY